jgi:CoA:oxalate CoA-transferase
MSVAAAHLPGLSSLATSRAVDAPLFVSESTYDTHRFSWRPRIIRQTAGLTRDEALARLRQADVPAAPVWSLDELLASGYIAARKLLQQGQNGKLGDIQLVPQPVRFSGNAPVAPMRAPTMGEDTEAVLRRDLGFDSTKIAALRAAKII